MKTSFSERIILQKEDDATWLNPATIEPEHLLPLLKPYPDDPDEEMEEWWVGDEARNPRNDSPELIKPIQRESHYLNFLVFHLFQARSYYSSVSKYTFVTLNP
ncbi:MAG: hypothetical protein ACREHC_03365 [Candidatus Levyibacteriota bacterium]